MKRMTKMTFAAAALSILAGLSSCRKDKTSDTTETIVSAEDNSTLESEFTSLFDVADDFSSNDRRTRAGNTILPSGAVVTFEDSSFTDGNGIKCTIDYGPLKTSAPKGLLCQDGRFRAGKVHLSLSKHYNADSAQLEVSISDSDAYYAGNNGVEMTNISGLLTITRMEATVVRIVVSNAKAVNDKGTVTWNSTRTITKLVDAGPGILGDQFSIDGSAAGVNRNGENFTVVINEPLLKKVELGCARTFVKGKVTLSNTSTGKSISIDYDPYNNQACDAIAKATINGREFFYTVR